MDRVVEHAEGARQAHARLDTDRVRVARRLPQELVQEDAAEQHLGQGDRGGDRYSEQQRARGALESAVVANVRPGDEEAAERVERERAAGLEAVTRAVMVDVDDQRPHREAEDRDIEQLGAYVPAPEQRRE